MKVHVLLFLFIWMFILPFRASDFTTLVWQKDTTRLGSGFPGASYKAGSVFPHYSYQFDLGMDYTSHTYTVSVEYPEYQYMNIPAGMEEQVKSLPSEPFAELNLQSSAHQGILFVDLVPLVYRDGRLMRLHSFRLVMDRGGVKRSPLVRGVSVTAPRQLAGEYASHSLLATGKWMKVSVPRTGVYQFTDSKLREMGFNDPSKVRVYGYGGALLAEDLRGIHPDDLCEVPVYRGDGRILFYAQGPLSWNANASYFNRVQNFYATAGSYFVTESDAAPASFPLLNTTDAPVATVTTFSERVLHEEDAYNWATSGRELYEGYNYVNGNKKSYSFNLPGISADKVNYTVVFAAYNESATSVNVDMNGTQVGTFSIKGYKDTLYSQYCSAMEAVHNGSWTSGQQENTTLTLTHNRPAGATGRLNFIVLNYRRVLKKNGSYFSFRDLNTVGKVVRYSIEDCDASTQVWDVTTPGAYARMQGTLNGSTYSFTGDNTTLREYVAVNVNSSYDTPSVVGSVANQDLHALEKPDMVIIVPSSASWRDHAERLAEAHRRKDNMVVHVVSAAEVYNEFSSGTPDATAYRWFMKMFYDRAGNDFGNVYLLLMGDCSYDNRMLTNEWKKFKPDDFLLCYQSPNSSHEVASYVTDDYLGMLATGKGKRLRSDVMDIGVGRFPVRNPEEARATVDKTIYYIENKESGPWKNRVCYAADDEDSGKGSVVFMKAAEGLASYTEKNHSQLMVNRVYQDAFPRVATASGFTYPQATKRLLSLIEEGTLMVNYTGHGGTNGWSAEFLLTINQIRALRNTRLSLWVTATCDFCRYDAVGYSAGEEAFLNEKGGAVALFTTSRVVMSGPNDVLNAKFNDHIFKLVDGKRLRLGDIMRLSKKPLDDENKLNFSLIGDPALMLTFPDHKVVLDRLNGEAVTESGLKLRAGDVVTLEGHVEDALGEKNTGFNGLVHPTVFDKKEHVIAYNHVGQEKAFEFDQYNSRLFSGSDSVRAGSFKISFPVPLDISYSNKEGMINLYAASREGMEGHGSFSNFTVGGTAPGALDTDSLGPDIWLYLNTPDFQAGGVVNPTPYLYAELRDEEGINATGNGVGHDIVATVDNSPLYSYVLNDYFNLAPGGYSRGTIQYQFGELPEGDHMLYFTAWDTKNNSSTYRLPFSVQASEAPTIVELSCYPVPAVTDLTFHFTHDRPGTNLKINIEVFAFSGACVWEHVLADQTSTGYYAYTWDLTTGDGRRLPPGVYLYRARFSTNGSEETTETLKFVVAAQ